MVKNYFYLIAGILSVFFAGMHAWNGYTTTLAALKPNLMDMDIKTTFHYVWHVITVENLVFGISLIYMAFYYDLSKVRFAARMIILLLAMRAIVILFFIMVYNKNSAVDFIPDTITMLLIMGLLFLGIRIKNQYYQHNVNM
jgi:hypothetical protein